MFTQPTSMTSFSPSTSSLPEDSVPTASPSPSTKPAQPPGKFPETQWTHILNAQQENKDARNALARAYWQPLYHFALREWRLDHHRAQDLVQIFFLERFWKCLQGKEKNTAPETADHRSTKLRTYLLAAFRNSCRSEWRRDQNVRHGSGAIHESMDDPDSTHGHESLADSGPGEGSALAAYDHDWALNIWERAVEALYQQAAQRGSSERFATLSAHGLVTRDPAKLKEPDYPALAAALKESEPTARQIVSRFRHDLRSLMRNEVQQTLHESLHLDEEYAYITRLLFCGAPAGNDRQAEP